MYAMCVVSISSNFWSQIWVAHKTSMTLHGNEPRERRVVRSWSTSSPYNCNHIWVCWCCRFNLLLLCIPSLSSPGVQHWAEAFASSLILNTRSAFFLLSFFSPSLCVCSDLKLWLQISVEESFEPRQLFLEANYCVLVNEPGRRNVKYIRLAATSLLSKGKTLTSP